MFDSDDISLDGLEQELEERSSRKNERKQNQTENEETIKFQQL